MNTLNKKISYVSLGLASFLSGCEENRNADISRGKIKCKRLDLLKI